jgi:hypothetical protein
MRFKVSHHILTFQNPALNKLGTPRLLYPGSIYEYSIPGYIISNEHMKQYMIPEYISSRY